MLPLIITTAFLALTLLPQAVLATTTIEQCLSSVQGQWSSLSGRVLTGETRHKTKCQLDLSISSQQLDIHAEGPPLEIQFSLGNNINSHQKIQQCKVDKEKIHLVFEETGKGQSEKNEKVQLTLLKREGTGWSMILSQRKLRVFQHTQQSHLICHLK